MVIEIEGSTLCRLANIHDLLTFGFKHGKVSFGRLSLMAHCLFISS